jgi:8-oxo-dGTP pyrophosphatase MutT (NUDIX family)
MARILSRTETRVSEWVRLVDKVVEMEPGAAPEHYHCLAQADYVTVVARTRSGRIPIVSQFRPALAAVVWELPGGLVDPGEEPAACCCRELREEAGVTALSVRALGAFYPDVGRLENRQHVFAVECSDPDPAFVAEPGMTVALVTPAELRARIVDGSFIHAMHLGALAAAELHGFALDLFR